MTRLRLILALLILGAPAGAAAADCPAPPQAEALASGLAENIAAARAGEGLAPVERDAELAQAAAAHACDMAQGGFFDHRGSDGSDVMARVRRAGYPACLAAENLAWGYAAPGPVAEGWMGSPGHRRNMLNAEVREIGIGLAEGPRGPIWVLVLAERC